MAHAVGVHGGAGVESSTVVVVAEPSAGLFDQDRGRRVIPDVAAPPHADVQPALGDPDRVVPGTGDRRTTGQALDELLHGRRQGVMSGQRGHAVGTQLSSGGDVDAGVAGPVA